MWGGKRKGRTMTAKNKDGSKRTFTLEDAEAIARRKRGEALSFDKTKAGRKANVKRLIAAKQKGRGR
jgi:hypothetical protein